jgi:DNA-binding beta-propeller fold protein YncE
VNSTQTLLFAVNSSSDTIAVFHIEPNSNLKPVKGSPFPSGGKAPASLGLAGNTLIVANKAQDGVRNLSNVHPNYTSFHVKRDGSLGAPISTITAPKGSSPLQAYVTPDQKVLITSQESGVFRAFRIGPGGTLTEGPDSPQRLPEDAFAHGHRQPNVWPAGLASNPTRKILYAELANVSRTVVYRWNDQARLTFVRSMPNRHSFLPCWTEVNFSGTRMYSANAGSDNISVFDIAGHPTKPREIQSLKLNRPGNPWNFQIDPTGRVIFLLDMRAVSQIPRGKGNQIHSLKIAADGRLSEERGSPVRIPVPGGTNPFGLAIVPRPHF